MFQVKLLGPDAIAPTRGSEHAAGYDLYAAKDYDLIASDRVLVSTQIAIAIPAGYYARIAPRSGLSCKGIDVGAGVIDADYRGEIKVLIINNHPVNTYQIKKGDRIAQLIITAIITPQIVVVDKLSDTIRGDGGFGSTGK